MNAWITILIAGVGTYLLRLSMIVGTDRLRIPARLDKSSVLIAPAAFAALAATSIGSTILSVDAVGALAPVAAVGVAILAVVRTGSTLAGILAGMPIYWAMTALVSG
jgi:branched-subunit amino acid transport protein